MKKYLVFHLGRERYGVNIENVQSIEPVPTITRIPTAETHVKGVMNLRGNVQPVIDLSIYFGMGTTEITADARVVMVIYDGISAGIMVNCADNVMDIDDARIEEPPGIVGKVKGVYLEGIANLEDSIVAILNLGLVVNQSNQQINEGSEQLAIQ